MNEINKQIEDNSTRPLLGITVASFTKQSNDDDDDVPAVNYSKLFQIDIKNTSLDCQWQIQCSSDDIKHLLEELSGFNEVLLNVSSHLSSFQDTASIDAEMIETALKTVIIEMGSSIFDNKVLVLFLDPSARLGKMNSVQIQYLNDKVKELNDQINSMSKQFIELKSSNEYLLTVVQQIQTEIRGSSPRQPSTIPADDRSEDAATIPRERKPSMINGTEEDGPPRFIAMLDGSAHSTLSSNCTEADLHMIQTERLRDSGNISQSSCPPIIEAENISTGEIFEFYNSAMDTILWALQPSSSSNEILQSMAALVRRQIRLSLNSFSMIVSLHRINCSLPDDCLVFSGVMCKSVMANWHTALSERLMLIANHRGDANNFNDPEEEEMMQLLPEDHTPTMKHLITDVSHSKLNMFKVHFRIDDKDVDVVGNDRSSICFLLFLEEVATLVGKDNLFKRSILLIRAWWNYETAAYVGTPIKHYLPELSLCVMVCAIFNMYHSYIANPLQALCLFLAEYSSFNGDSHAISLQGIVPFHSTVGNQPILKTAESGHLIQDELVEKYWHLMNISYNSADPNQLDHYQKLNTSSEDIGADGFPGLSLSQKPATTTAAAMMASPAVTVATPDESDLGQVSSFDKTNMSNLSKQNLFYFERHSFSVIHPFTHSNMIIEKLSPRRHMRLTKAFQIGAQKLLVYLKPHEGSNGCADDILNYFPTIVTRFGDILKKDGPTDSSSDRGEIFIADEEGLRQHLMYCNIMFESVIAESALKQLSIEILASKGPLPVGEIGKILAEMTSIANFSQKLKEKFGGLKKFLENFQNKFVISNDHPFNPNVFLRDSLSTEHLDLIDRGIFPHQLLLKSKKTSTASKKKKNVTNNSDAASFRSDYSSTGSINSVMSYGQYPHINQRYYGNNSGLSSPSIPQSAVKYPVIGSTSIAKHSAPPYGVNAPPGNKVSPPFGYTQASPVSQPQHLAMQHQQRNYSAQTQYPAQFHGAPAGGNVHRTSGHMGLNGNVPNPYGRSMGPSTLSHTTGSNPPSISDHRISPHSGVAALDLRGGASIGNNQDGVGRSYFGRAGNSANPLGSIGQGQRLTQRQYPLNDTDNASMHDPYATFTGVDCYQDLILNNDRRDVDTMVQTEANEPHNQDMMFDLRHGSVELPMSNPSFERDVAGSTRQRLAGVGSLTGGLMNNFDYEQRHSNSISNFPPFPLDNDNISLNLNNLQAMTSQPENSTDSSGGIQQPHNQQQGSFHSQEYLPRF